MPRPDVIAALETLSDRDAHRRWLTGEQTWPDLANAIHWLIDDTWWDDHPAIDEVGTILRSAEEALAVQKAVDLVCAVVDEVESTDDDAVYVSHPRWDSLVEVCEHALRLLQQPAS